MNKPKNAQPEPFRVWIGFDTDANDICTWSAARSKAHCRHYLREVYSEEAIGTVVKFRRATLTMDLPKPRRKEA